MVKRLIRITAENSYPAGQRDALDAWGEHIKDTYTPVHRRAGQAAVRETIDVAEVINTPEELLAISEALRQDKPQS